MTTAKQQAETDQAIMEACKKLFFTAAIPEMCKYRRNSQADRVS